MGQISSTTGKCSPLSVDHLINELSAEYRGTDETSVIWEPTSIEDTRNDRDRDNSLTQQQVERRTTPPARTHEIYISRILAYLKP